MNFGFSDKLWFWEGPAAWCFVTVPIDLASELKALSGSATPGWGMIPVAVKVGQTEWNTSIFPSDGGFVLPVKAAVPKKEGLKEGDEVFVRLQVR